ncbi:hypothetical protein C9994_04290 [Marivirga lumbricoides]|uniref:DUF3347 domain-containing protein n=1 Tax=Marivirga lumbricoides TaxID=1046115 RepID=A0A2T4DTL2_9BACT|nr:hypothetical protein C9994_04290 [Marivirga lumbricoides]
MRIQILTVAVCLTSILFSSCNTQSSEQKSETAVDSEVSVTDDGAQNLKAGTVSKEQLEGMLSAYFNIKNALVDTHAENAKSATNELIKHISDGMHSIQEVAKKIQERETIDQIREDFEVLSQDIYKLIKENPEVEKETVYKQYCPMALDNKGAFWLSNQEEIKNPYFGNKMLKCGKVQEKL